MRSKAELRKKVAAFPEKPGIYFFKNEAGEVLYIGKARSLRDRVQSYFLPDTDEKVRHIIAETADVDYLLTGSEKDAAFLENNFVRQHQPKYNLRLKDDKSFPYLKVTVKGRFPGIYFSRRVEPDGSRYFGPFSPASRARTSLRLVNRLFRLRGCKDAVFKGRTRPCLDYELKLCSGPCAGLVGEAEYRSDVEAACLFLEGRTGDAGRSLRARMEQAAERRDFEEAARLRDALLALEDIKEAPATVSVKLEDQDVLGFARRGDEAALCLFMMRRGKVIDSVEQVLSARAEDKEPGGGRSGNEDARLAAAFLDSLYGGRSRPDRLLLPYELLPGVRSPRSLPGLKADVKVSFPKGGRQRRFVELAMRNARAALDKRAELAPGVAELQGALGLAAPPRVIEGVDISNTGGGQTVGSLVVFKDGRPARSLYRKFRIRTVEGPNDVAGLAEVVRRRFARLKRESAAFPDLLMVDGGKGQLGAASSELSWLGIDSVPVVAIAKREELLYSRDHPEGLRLPRFSPALKLIQRVRDEAHRFAVTFHRGLRKQAGFGSLLDGVPGLGPAKKRKLLETFPDLEALRAAPLEAIIECVGRGAGRAVKERLAAARDAGSPASGPIIAPVIREKG